MTDYKCQNCHLPLRLDSSILDLSDAQRKLLLNSKANNVNQYKIPTDRLKKLDMIKAIDDSMIDRSLVQESFVFLKNKDKGSSPISKQDLPATTDSAYDYERSLNTDITDTEKELYMGVDDDESDTSVTVSKQIKVLNNMFNILSNKSSIDYPLCQECCDYIIEKMNVEYDELTKEKEIYEQFINRLKKQKNISKHTNKHTDDGNSNETNKVDNSMKNEMETLFETLEKLEDENAEMDKVIDKLNREIEKKKDHEKRLIFEINKNEFKKYEYYKEIESLNNQYENSLNQMDRLRKLNLFNEAFKISHQGPFGVINNLRIGGYAESPVSWNEINTGIGQIILLLNTIVQKFNIKLSNYKLEPRGTFSRIFYLNEETHDWIKFDTFNDENFKIGKFFHKETDFDKAMESILAVMNIICESLGSTSLSGDPEDTATETNLEPSVNDAFDDSRLELPYHMHRDNINGISVKLYGGKPTLDWTTAMKFVLTNAKWLLVYCSTRLETKVMKSTDNLRSIVSIPNSNQ